MDETVLIRRTTLNSKSMDPDTSDPNKQAPWYSIMIQFCLISMKCIYTNKRNQSNTDIPLDHNYHIHVHLINRDVYIYV